MKPILDNPIYQSLLTGHQSLSQGADNAKYYPAGIAPFAGLKDNSPADFEMLYDISGPESKFVIFTIDPIDALAPWKIKTRVDMFQMVHGDTVADIPHYNKPEELDTAHVPQMTALVELTKPGPFRPGTIELGNYTGIFKDNELIAMAGHRFNPSPYTEISAVCTHPDHLGKGYAFILLQEQIKRIRQRSEIPFLHVRNDNYGAIKLYEKIGFSVRTEMIAYFIER